MKTSSHFETPSMQRSLVTTNPCTLYLQNQRALAAQGDEYVAGLTVFSKVAT